jgi:hypothetical protein
LTLAPAEKNIITDNGTKRRIVQKSGCKAIRKTTKTTMAENGIKLF